MGEGVFLAVGLDVVGAGVGFLEGLRVGSILGKAVGLRVGSIVGLKVGSSVGIIVLWKQ